MVSSGIRKVFNLLLSPFCNSIDDFERLRILDKKAMHASLAFPSTGGAAIRIHICPDSSWPQEFVFAFGLTSIRIFFIGQKKSRKKRDEIFSGLFYRTISNPVFRKA
jgi:hypothetical protein